MKKKISLVVILYNEETSIKPFLDETVPILESINDIDYEIIFVNDRSKDNSLEELKKAREQNSKVKIIHMSRRFGPMESIMAGVKMSSGDALINIDIDLQDPPSLIPKMVKYWRDDNFDVVFTTRLKRHGESSFKKIISSIGYKILKVFTYVEMEKDSGDYKLISKRVIEEYKKFNENYPFFRFVVDWIGFERKQIFYERRARKAGKSQHPFGLGVIFNFFEISLTPFSDFPIRFSLIMGFLSFIISSFVLLRTAFLYFSGETQISSTSIFLAILFFGSIQALILGFLGLYLGSIHKQSKNRPMYIIDKLYGFDKEN